MANDDFDSQCSALTRKFEELFRPLPIGLPDKVQQIIKANPSPACAVALACAVLTVVEENPRSVDSVTIAISRILSLAEDVVVRDQDSNEPFGDSFRMNISEFLTNPMHEIQYSPPKHTTISPSNKLLAYALISACAVQHGVIDDSPFYPFVDFGLSMPITTLGDDQREIVIIAACLQAVIAGNVMMRKWAGAAEGIANVVVELEKEKGSIKYPHGVALLEKTIDAAKAKFDVPLSSADAWTLLFP